jgi:hypothetical protein
MSSGSIGISVFAFCSQPGVTGASLRVGAFPRLVRRLTAHYGPGVAAWLRSAPKLVVEISSRYGLRFQGFYDAGWTSVVATATTDLDEQPVIIKAVPDARRFAREAAALTHWRGIGACRLLHADRVDQVLLLSTVEQVGGACRPPDHQTRVSAVLPSLHARRSAAHPDVPDLPAPFRSGSRRGSRRRHISTRSADPRSYGR